MVIVPSDFDLYVKCSRAFKKICASYTPVMESFSIDEVFLDMTGTSLLYPDPIAAAHEIKDRISDELGFTVNVGISTNKLLAKMASDFEKPNKVHTLFPEEIPAKMWPLPVRELLFLGKASEKKLTEAGIRTIGDLAHAWETDIQTLIGNKNGHQLYQYARGIDDSPVKAQPDEAKGFSVETTFNEDIVSIEQVDPILLAQCDIVAARMRRKKKKCTSVSITFRTLDFRNRSHQTKLPNATDITDEIYRCAKQLFRESWKGEPLRLIGVSVTGLTEDDFEQLSLFEDPEKKEKSRKLDAALDAIRQKFGNDKVTRASILNGTQGIARKAKAQMKNDAEN
jgi:DNA polymerase-4